MNIKPKTKPVPIRLDDKTKTRIQRAAARMGSTSSAVIRFAITQQLQGIESGTIILNPES